MQGDQLTTAATESCLQLGNYSKTLRSATVNHEHRCLQSSVFLPRGSRWHGTDAFILEKPTAGYNWFSLVLSSRDSLADEIRWERKKKQTQAHTLAHDMKQELSGSLCFVTWYCFQLEDFTPFLALYTYTWWWCYMKNMQMKICNWPKFIINLGMLV